MNYLALIPINSWAPRHILPGNAGSVHGLPWKDEFGMLAALSRLIGRCG